MEENIIEEVIIKSNGEKTMRKYTKGKLLGKGSETECYEFINLETKKLFACKLFPRANLKKGKAKQRLKSEIRIQSRLSHPNIVKFERFFQDSENFYLLLELCSNQNLSELLRRRKRLTEIEAQCYLLQFVSALKYLHGLKIIHRDLKLNNLFLTDKMELKIGDFTNAAKIEVEGERKSSICGTPNFMAPEIIEGSHSYEADVWSLGVILYTILVGKPPFHSDKSKVTYAKIKACAYSFPESCSISNCAKELINKILVSDYKKRLSLDQILEDNFFSQGYNVPKLMPISTLVAPPSTPRIKKSSRSPSPRVTSRRPSTPKKSDKMTPEQFKSNVKMQGSVFTGFGTEEGIYVKQWIDYTWKYGLGYLLSNGNFGVSFIDSTRMILDTSTSQIIYLDKSENSKSYIHEYTLTEAPEELKKKISLLQYFKNYLETDIEVNYTKNDEKIPVYLKKWMITRHAIIFRLSSRSVQFNFLDHSQLTLNCDLRIVTFSNKKGNKIRLKLVEAIKSKNIEITRRLKYTRDAIKHMIKFKT
jgi:polo-like kinase 1